MKRKAVKRTSPKHIARSSKKKQWIKGDAKDGALYAVAIIAVAATFAGMMAGGVLPTIINHKPPPGPGPTYTCCDSGDGTACHPLTGAGQTITYNGATYGLLKSDILLSEDQHDVPTNSYTPDGHRIFINTTGSTGFDAAKAHGSILPGSGCVSGSNQDYIGLHDGAKYGHGAPYFGGYVCVPQGEIIYVCRASVQECAQQNNVSQLPFDAYYRVNDGPVPYQITTDCPKPSGAPSGTTSQQVISVPTPGGRKNLQLETFQVKQQQTPYKWLDSWCKPAINLYPPQEETVHVAVAPQGKLNLTIPSYPDGGWDVTAYPDGKIVTGGMTYPYLYWEAAMPNDLIHQPDTGYVVAYDQLANLFTTVLPQTGLNDREATQFSSYWLKALPEAPYYFVGLMPQSEINTLAPLTVSPTPDSTLRVTLYFKALEQKESVTPPQYTPFTRSGFVVTEWGGFFQADKNHPGFTCLM